jgi:hypothetical protein
MSRKAYGSFVTINSKDSLLLESLVGKHGNTSPPPFPHKQNNEKKKGKEI